VDIRPRPPVKQTARSLGQRVIVSGAACMLLLLSVESALDVLSTLRADSVERSPSLGVMLATALGASGLVVGIDALRRVGRPALAARAIAAFGWGWLVGVVLDVVISATRVSTSESQDALTAALNLLSWGIVSLLLGIPGFASLLIARSLGGGKAAKV
jgi:hypothetical protein